MRIKTIWLRLFLYFGVALLIFGVIVALAQQLFLTNVQLTNAKEQLSSTSNEVIDEFKRRGINNKQDFFEFSPKSAEVRQIVDRESIENYIQIIISIDGENVYGSTETEVATVRSQGKDANGSFYLKKDEENDASYLAYVRAFFDDDDNMYIEMRAHLKAFEDNIKVTQVFTQLVSVGAILLSILWAFVFSKIFTKPIVKMNKMTRSLASLKFEDKLVIDRSDELGELAENINLMSDRLKLALSQLRVKNMQLQAELDKAKELENMRKNFVSDVSHELKTPLTVIHGYAEALSLSVNKDKESRQHYAKVIMDETEKMTKLVHGLLNLSQYTSGAFGIEKTVFDMNELVTDIGEKFQNIFEQHAINFETDIQKPAEVFGDRLRIEQVLTNYLNNAISHADENKQIIITGRKQEKSYKVSVFNSGNHITEEDAQKLWTPFYRVDKSRNREEGRYGIGLSIVKALIELHGGEYGVNNITGGVEFYFTLPYKIDGEEDIKPQDLQEEIQKLEKAKNN